MRMRGSPGLPPAATAAGDPTDALFADQSQSNRDNLVALLSQSRAWNCSAEAAPAAAAIARRVAVLSGHGLTRYILLYMTLADLRRVSYESCAPGSVNLPIDTKLLPANLIGSSSLYLTW